MSQKKLINPPSTRTSKAPFAQGVQVGETLYVSGQIAQDADGKIVGVGDMVAQARQVFTNIEVVLTEAGCSFKDVVKITCYVSDMRHYAGYSKVRAEVFPDADIASATVISPGFVNPDALIEIETIAVTGSGG
ncbi:MAG: 2-iminobutanoate/2-iminopropanoate deaminase [Alphaproteobacteria bacterium MarineAlpha4_Bin2]|nr:MAG: 2-iminobutanoate/2-iminopropanoate deaminase [Alphaproteobacteria bacterium MarineAlpha4_Bin2]|tara:strand:+ start:319 stop:717 length:399 start_codon:yes stop_codon:yes gene_type:complete